MKVVRPAPDYLPPSILREEAAPSELEVQALWFEQLFQPRLKTDDGREVEVVQPGFWNHAGGPDFSRAVLRFFRNGQPEKELAIGNVEVHLRPDDWQTHGHDVDPAYDKTILHVVWETPGRRAFFPATSTFRRVPQVVLGRHLVAPWAELRPLCGSLTQRPLPGAMPGRCSPVLASLPEERMTKILRAAGIFRVRQKAQRLFWRRKLTSPEQALFESLAEALGFHANQVPMRLVAQRLPWKMLRALEPTARLAHLFGLSGFLPGESLARLQKEPRAWLRELWELWWKKRGSLDYALMSRAQWKLAGLRPFNRPERRLAALAQLVPRVPGLIAAMKKQNADEFVSLLVSVRDEFWEQHATLTGTPLATPSRLIGEERAHDMLINIFWPGVFLDDAAAAEKGLREMHAASNSATQVAGQRLGLARPKREALIQQGLLQIFRDYCQTDCSNCRDCTFPELVRKWETSSTP